MLIDPLVAIALHYILIALRRCTDRAFFSQCKHVEVFISPGLILTLGAFYVQNSFHWTGYLPQNK